MSVALVTTVREPDASFSAFLAWYEKLGVERIYVFLDDPADTAAEIARRYASVSIIPCDESLRARWAKLPSYDHLQPYLNEVISRQQLNAELALRMARAEGIDWLLHVDADERLVVSGGSLAEFATAVPLLSGLVTFSNHEAAPTQENVDNCFAEVDLFKRNPRWLSQCADECIGTSGRRWYFNSYANGKSMVRVSDQAYARGVHSFMPSLAHPNCLMADESAVILHYANCGVAAFVRKYKLRGAFPSRYSGGQPIIEFHGTARDVYRSAGEAGLKSFYQSHVLYADLVEREQFERDGVLMRFAPITTSPMTAKP